VRPEGVDLIPITLASPQRHWRMARHLEFDVCEYSLASYLAWLGAGSCPLTAIPAFPHRRFRHGYLFVRAGSGLRSPERLAGRRVGLRTWQTTAGLWLRGILQDEHGLDLHAVRWVTQDEEDLPLPHLRGFAIERAPRGETVTDLLRQKKLDALIYPEAPPGLGDTIVRLFDDPKQAEIAYFRRTGVFPIMHTVVVKRSLLAERPWVARSLLEAFRESARIAFQAMRNPRTISLAWSEQLVEEERQVLGPDPWAYGVEASRAALEAGVRYGHEQGFLPEPIAAESLFFPSTREEPPRYV
jgi:4,5-dihydroxyphthalate decarboxylase